MVEHTARLRTAGATAERTPFAVETVAVTRLIVPLDGSPFSERALPVAGWAAGALGAGVHLIEVAGTDEDAEAAVRYLGSVSLHHHTTSWDVVEDDDVAGKIVDAVGRLPGGLACLATHGRDRSTALVGSVVGAVLDRSERTVLLAGPAARPVTAPDAPVAVAVEGTARDEVLMPVALGWAARLGRRLLIVTVAEPVPAMRDDAGPRRAHGPGDPESYVAALAARAADTGVTVETRVVYDPIGVSDGLVPELGRGAALVVIGSRHRRGLARIVLGSHAARIVHDAGIPALAVPIPAHPH